ncbi:hypothetical protein F4604DRAFT_1918553 [Suillus subluteus]|nr:hypothetical protein F4604DRAFT_1918553 [Suillus subluteus]
MEPATQLSFPFGDLPVELALLILKHAAQPSFSQTEPYKSKNPYSFTLALCLLSKDVRKMVLPEILHTCVAPAIPQCDSVRGHSTTYAGCGWDGLMALSQDLLSQDFIPMLLDQCHPGPDLSLLAPVLLAAPSIAVDFENVGLLSGCLFYASKSRVDNH